MNNSVSLHICPDDKFYQAFIRNQKTHASDTENEYYVISEEKDLRNDSDDAAVKMLSIFCLKNNIPVIFWKDSMMYRFYTENGFHVFAIEDLDSYPAHVTKDQKENNIYHNSSIKKLLHLGAAS